MIVFEDAEFGGALLGSITVATNTFTTDVSQLQTLLGETQMWDRSLKLQTTSSSACLILDLRWDYSSEL